MTDYQQFDSLDDLATFIDFWFSCDVEVGKNPYTFLREITLYWDQKAAEQFSMQRILNEKSSVLCLLDNTDFRENMSTPVRLVIEDLT